MAPGCTRMHACSPATAGSWSRPRHHTLKPWLQSDQPPPHHALNISLERQRGLGLRGHDLACTGGSLRLSGARHAVRTHVQPSAQELQICLDGLPQVHFFYPQSLRGLQRASWSRGGVWVDMLGRLQACRACRGVACAAVGAGRAWQRLRRAAGAMHCGWQMRGARNMPGVHSPACLSGGHLNWHAVSALQSRAVQASCTMSPSWPGLTPLRRALNEQPQHCRCMGAGRWAAEE